MKPEEAHKLIYDELGFCGCGETKAAVKLVKLVLLLMDRKRNSTIREKGAIGSYEYYYEKLRKLLPNKGVYYYALYTLDNKGFLEHGSMVDNAWLTEKGKAFLECLQKWGVSNVSRYESYLQDTIEEFGEEDAYKIIKNTYQW